MRVLRRVAWLKAPARVSRQAREVSRLQEGQASAEYVGVLLVVGSLVTALLIARPGMPEAIARGVDASICVLLDSSCDDSARTAIGSPGPPGPPDLDARRTQPDHGGDDRGVVSNVIDQWGQYAGGTTAQLWDEVKGLGGLAAWAWRTTTSAEQRRENGEVWDAIVDDPWGAVTATWNGMWEPVVEEHGKGRDAAALGRFQVIGASAVFGGKGLTKLSKLAKARSLANAGAARPVANARRGLPGQDRSRRGDPCPVGNSFTADTQVLLADGSSIAISEVDVGMLVAAGDPDTDEVGARPVTDVIVGAGWKRLVAVGADGGTVVATDNHPFSVADRGWVAAGELEPGDLLVAPDGGHVVVDTVEDRVTSTVVYNLTVADLHTYQVLAGDEPVLVHNQDRTRPCGPGGSAPDPRPTTPSVRPGPPDPAGGVVTYGRNALAHLRSHARDIRLAARADGIDIPKKPTKPATQQAMKDYIKFAVDHADRNGVRRYKEIPAAIWSERGNLIIIRKTDGEWVTALRSGERAALNAPWLKGPS